jgi:hypothetical protein
MTAQSNTSKNVLVAIITTKSQEKERKKEVYLDMARSSASVVSGCN